MTVDARRSPSSVDGDFSSATVGVYLWSTKTWREVVMLRCTCGCLVTAPHHLVDVKRQTTGLIKITSSIHFVCWVYAKQDHFFVRCSLRYGDRTFDAMKHRTGGRSGARCVSRIVVTSLQNLQLAAEILRNPHASTEKATARQVSSNKKNCHT